MFRPTSFTQNSNGGDSDDPEPNFATGAKFAVNNTKEIEIPVTNGLRLSLILYANAPNVSATLLDEQGEIVGKNLAGSAEAAQIFRTITVKKSFQSGKWKLRIENREPTETEIIITTFIDFNQTVRQTAD